jgi:hypothetical protein
MDNMNYVFLEGGTGVRVGLAVCHLADCKAYASKGKAEGWNMVYETMDAGAEEIGEILKLLSDNEQLDFCDPSINFAFLKMAERVKKKLQEEGDFCLEKVAPEWFKNELLLTKEELQRDLLGGYYRDLVIGSIASALAMDCAMETQEDKKAGFQAIVDAVVASNNRYEVRVAFAGSGIGGEGRTNLCMHPAMLKKLCIESVIKELHMQYNDAETYVEKNLKIAVIMLGGAFRFPAIEGLDQDVAGLVAGTLRNYPKDSADAVNLFYLLEHDCMPVQAEFPSDSGLQFKHAHAIELVAVAMIENFFNRTTEEVEKRCPVIPHYSLPGNSRTNWENLGLPDSYRMAMSARLRFDAALFYWVRPQLILSSKERNAGKIYDSEILSKMFGGKTGKRLESAIADIGFDVDSKMITPLSVLLDKETRWLSYLRDVCLTGKNWETGAMPAESFGTSLFPVDQIDKLLEHTHIRYVGGMTGYKLDALTDCPESNRYHTGMTLDRIRSQITYTNHGTPRDFKEIMGGLYEMCSKVKEKKYGIFGK